jgi:hypothetical protein
MENGHVPDWMGSATLAKAKSFFERNLNGVGRTDVKFDEKAPLVIVTESRARTAISALARTDEHEETRIPELESEDLSRLEIGSLEGDVIGLTTYYGRPAILLRERLSGRDLPCVLSTTLAEQIGHEHDWAEVWTNRRVQMSGELAFDRRGHVRRINAISITSIDSRPLTYSDIADPNFTNGLSIEAYLRQLWEDEVG